MTKPYTILSLDLATSTGWCLIQDAQYRYSGLIPLPKHSEYPGLMFVKFLNWLQDYRGVDEIFFERVPRFESRFSAEVYCGLLGVLHIFRLTHDIRLTSIKSKTAKMIFTGNGNAEKTVVCKVAHWLGWQGGHPDTDINHDEAEAIAIAYSLLHKRNVELIFTTPEEKAT